MTWLKRFAWGVGAVVALGLVAWLAVPALIQWQVPPRLTEALGRPVTLGKVAFKPWALDLTLDDLEVGNAAVGGATSGAATLGAAPLLRIRRLHADLSIASLVKRAPGSGRSRSTRRNCASRGSPRAATTSTT